ncbi:MAG: VCBS repeat-containing protein [Deltaproteobacteria bacterium]|nr:VCBS repeat-containing protein [Deltaproteobacteria bacterium]
MRSTSSILTALIASLLLTGCNKEGKEELADLRGLVLTERGLPIEGAAVAVGDRRVQTQADGSFLVEGLSPAPWVVRVSRSGRSAATLRADLSDGSQPVVAHLLPAISDLRPVAASLALRTEQGVGLRLEGALEDGDGAPVSGNIELGHALLHTPGRLAALPPLDDPDLVGAQALFLSVTQDGRPVSLRGELTLDLPRGSAVDLPEDPVWVVRAFDASLGLWQEQGTAALEADGRIQVRWTGDGAPLPAWWWVGVRGAPGLCATGFVVGADGLAAVGARWSLAGAGSLSRVEGLTGEEGEVCLPVPASGRARAELVWVDEDGALQGGAREVMGGDAGGTCEGGGCFAMAQIALTLLTEDDDGDGLSELEGDCDDRDPRSYAGASELPGDQLDWSCDGQDGVDADRDGWPVGEDCDEADWLVQPGSTLELDINGVDEDCDGLDGPDRDRDGFVSAEVGGDDCDDAQDSRYPGADELACDGLDNDCDGLGELLVPEQYGAVQDAVDAALSGEVVCVAQGTWPGPVDFAGKTLTLVGEGVGLTVIDAEGGGAALSMVGDDGGDSLVQDLTLTGGDAACGGGVFLDGASPTLLRVALVGNTAERGGGACLIDSDAYLEGVSSADNRSWDQGGGIWAYGGGPLIAAFSSVGDEAWADGGGLYLDDTRASLVDVAVWGARARGDGGGAAIRGGEVRWDRARLQDNTAERGGGLAVTGGATLSLDQALIAWNRADSEGGGLYLAGADLGLVHGRLSANHASEGGGVALGAGATLDLSHSILAGNAAPGRCGGLRVGSAFAEVNQTVIHRSEGDGACLAGGELRLGNSAITASSGVGLTALSSDGYALAMRYSVLHGSGEGDLSQVVNPVGISGNFAEAPHYMGDGGDDPSAWDLHLMPQSALVDSGDPAWLDPDASRSDVGAYGGAQAGGWDLDGDGFFGWWQPGPADPGAGWDLEDTRADLTPGADADGDGFTPLSGDCDDTDPAVYQGAEEVCDGVDNDCDGALLLDERDLDGDGGLACAGDCDDLNPELFAEATEVCDGVDNDCDGLVDDADGDLALAGTDRWYRDADGDGFGDWAWSVQVCAPPDGFVVRGGDCDDADPALHPEAPDPEGDAFDANCDGVDGVDADGDRFVASLDCDDGDALTYPGSTHDLDVNGHDEDCDGVDGPDRDGDGFVDAVVGGTDCDDADPAIHPGAAERCDGIDADCSGGVEWQVPGDFDAIQPAIDASSPEDTVCVGAGDWPGSLVVRGPLTLLGVEGSAATRVLGAGDGPVVTVSGLAGGEARFEGLTLEGGQAYEGGGLQAEGGDIALHDVALRGNVAEFCGGLMVRRGSLVAQDLTLADNTAAWTGAGGCLISSEADITGLSADRNAAGGAGGALYMQLSEVSIRGAWLEGNQAERGAAFSLGGGSLTLEGAELLHHQAVNGGAIYADSAGLFATDLTVEQALATAEGGALLLLGGEAELTRLHLLRSTAEGGDGGGLLVRGGTVLLEQSLLDEGSARGSGAGIEAEDAAQVRVRHTLFRGGEALTGDGGGISLKSGAVLSCEACGLLGNSAQRQGGGAAVGSGSLSLDQVALVRNQAGGSGGALSLSGGVTTLHNADLSGNRAGVSQDAVLVEGAATLEADYLNLWDNDAELPGASGVVRGDPAYADLRSPLATQWDLVVGTASPLVDAGDPLVLDPDGGPSDLGLFGGLSADGWDLDGDGAPAWWMPGGYDPSADPDGLYDPNDLDEGHSPDSDADGDGWSPREGDCDDGDSRVFPGAIEICDGQDNDCDGALLLDELDLDGDGVAACEGDCDDEDWWLSTEDRDGDGYSGCDGDCDDLDPLRSPVDGDGDGYSACDGDCDDADPLRGPVDRDGDGLSGCEGDCDDGDAQIFPGAPERCDGLDDDCDGALSEDELDPDGDGYGACAGDCDAADPLVHPDAAERCNGLDDNCDGVLPAGEQDVDGDGAPACDDCNDFDPDADLLDRDGDGYSSCAGDCDDLDPARFPSHSEDCDGVDNDCDGFLGVGEKDRDGDGVMQCAGDCADTDPARYPGAVESCDGVDNDCTGMPDPSEEDRDGDGWMRCEGDCDDMNATTHPGASERCDRRDNDCDGLLGVAEVDGDGDGVLRCEGDCDDADDTIYPGAEDLCDGVDNNCDGFVAEAERDKDGDGVRQCAGDCDDGDADVYPGAPELCDGKSNGCTGSVGEDENDWDADGWRVCAGDCDDWNSGIHPGAAEYCNRQDDDCDGALPPGEQDVDGDGVAACDGDCDDADGARFPGAYEACDGVDNDCDGRLGNGEIDGDGDGWRICDGDCDDRQPTVYPGAPEQCDGLANACAGLPADEGDGDLDGYRICEGDCNDWDAYTHPGASERCDGVDNDCDLSLPPDELDADTDGWTPCGGDCDDTDYYRHPGVYEDCNGVDDDCDGSPASGERDEDGDGWRVCAGDCDDTNADTHPGADELCDGLDNSCDGGLPSEEQDRDGDGFMECADDCDDWDPWRYPYATEICNGRDDDCDGVTPTDEEDPDHDGVSACGGDCEPYDGAINPGAWEYANGWDDNCNGMIDEGTNVYDDDLDGFTEDQGDCDDTDASRYPGAPEVRLDGVDQDCTWWDWGWDSAVLNNERVGAWDLAVADLDEDGDDDIISMWVNSADAEYYWMEHRWGREYVQREVIFGHWDTQSHGLRAGDLNGDGHADLITTHGWDHDLLLHIGHGGAGFSTPAVIYNGGSEITDDLCDMDGDGDLDILMAEDGGAVRFLLNDGAANFVEQAAFTGPFPQPLVACWDMDNNGVVDVVVGNADGSLKVYEQSAPGSFVVKGNLPPQTSRVRPQAVNLLGFGQDELVVTTGAGDVLHYVCDCASACNCSDIAKLHHYGTLPTVVPSDIENDGDQDLLMVGTDNQIELLENYGYGDVRPLYSLNQGGGQVMDLEAGDFNGYGQAGVVALTADGLLRYYIDVFYGWNDLGNVGLPALRGLASGDFDGDGDLDVVAGTADGRLYRWFNYGYGSFAPTGAADFSSVYPSLKELVAVDADRDGDLDLVGWTGTQVLCLLNNGSGVFYANSVEVSFPTNVPRAAADLDGDGWDELLFAVGSTVEAATWDGVNTWDLVGDTVLPAMTFGYDSVAPIDFRQDGTVSLVATDDWTLSVYDDRDTPGTWSAVEVVRDVEGEPWIAAVGDFDGDGTMGVALGNPYGQILIVHGHR